MQTYFLAAACVVGAFFASNAQAAASLELEPCHVRGFAEQVECGFLTVPENYDQPNGRTIDIHVVRLRAVASTSQPDPLLFLAGGPGQAATELVAGVAQILRDARQQRDLLFIDQRGTGKSNPLQCESDDLEEVFEALIVHDRDIDLTAETRKCAAQYDAEFQHYHTLNAVRDFDAVRAALGYNQVNLYGGSYGTRSGLAYMREFPERIRAAVLDGLAPPQVTVGLFGQTSEVAFSRMLSDCQAQEACAAAFPDLANDYLSLREQLRAEPQLLRQPDPRSHRQTDFLLTDTRLQQMLFAPLYTPRTRQMMPYVIHEAAQGNYAPLIGLNGTFEGRSPLYMGLMLSVLCQEDLPYVTAENEAAESQLQYMGINMLQNFQNFCAGWPVEQGQASWREPVRSDIPTLLLSGGQDPVTPAAWADLAAETLSQSTHLVAEHGGHTIIGHTCANRIASRFIDQPSAEVDGSCLEQTKVLPFLLNVNARGM
ncbi:MAG: alpha/beta hydrolase [Idiomarina sp.]|nr:alpha/beta hydrolase [Idiomarina sp.]